MASSSAGIQHGRIDLLDPKNLKRRYVLMERIESGVAGAGSFGTVNLAWDHLQGCLVAIKRQKFHHRGATRELLLFRLLASMPPHPNVMRMLDHWVTGEGEKMELELVLEAADFDLERRRLLLLLTSTGSRWLWLALAGSGWTRLALAGSGWLWLALAGSGWP